MKANKLAQHWRSDLECVFKDGLLERAIVNDSSPAPLIIISSFDDIARFFFRIGLSDLFTEHMRDLKNPPKMPNPDDEIRIFYEFTYGFTVLQTNRKYTLFCGVWYFKNRNEPIGGHMGIAIAPAGMEGLVQSGMKNLL